MSARASSPIRIGLNAVILAVTDEEPRILIVRREDAKPVGGPAEALPSGPLDPGKDRTLELALRGWVREQAGLELGYVEQLYTFGSRFRDPRERTGGPRALAIAYLALLREAAPSGASAARWLGAYDFLPWEDWRTGRPGVIDRFVEPALEEWTRAAADPKSRRQRRERLEIVFGLGGAAWDGERVLDRFELLYEAGLVEEAWRDRRLVGESVAARDSGVRLGRALALDHRRILSSALGRLRGKLRYRPVVFELLPASFTLLRLQRVVEALSGVRLHKQNFRRLVEQGGLVEGTGRIEGRTGGRPAERFRFRREALRERPAPGVGLPGHRSAPS